MREILFRGQTRKLGQKVNMNGDKLPGIWVYGGIFPGTGDYSIIYGGETEQDLERYVVWSDTVGQYTGCKDKNGKLIFEGDIVLMPKYGKGKHKAVVYFRNGKFAVDGSNYAFKDLAPKGYEVIGNIYDNPELMEN